MNIKKAITIELSVKDSEELRKALAFAVTNLAPESEVLSKLTPQEQEHVGLLHAMYRQLKQVNIA